MIVSVWALPNEQTIGIVVAMDQLAQLLRSERERQRRTLRDLALETKIREPILAALERGEFRVLPALYVKSFIKTYARALRISAVETNRLLDEVFDPEGDAADVFPARRTSSRSEPRSKAAERNPAEQRLKDLRLGSSLIDAFRGFPIWVWIVAAAVVITSIVLLIFPSDDSDASMHTSLDSTSGIVQVDAAAGLDRDSLVLTAVVRDTAWISITADGSTSHQTVLLPGATPRWSAVKTFDISMSNAGGATFYRNGIQLPPFGKTGESVRSIRVTMDDVRTSSAAWRQPPPALVPKSAPPTVSEKAKPKSAVVDRSSRKPVERPSITPAPVRQLDGSNR